MRLRSVLLLALTALLVPCPTNADPYDPATLVTVPSPLYKAPLAMATNSVGESIGAWSERSSAGTPAYFIERFDALGRPVGEGKLAVGTHASDVAIDDAGNFAFVRHPTSAWLVSQYERSGQFVRDVRVEDPGARVPAGNLTPAAISMNARGQFVVTWVQETATAAGAALVAKSFAADGSALSPTIVVYDGRPAFEPDVAIEGSGNYVVSWDRFRSATERVSEVWVKRFSSGGAPLCDALRVNTDTRAEACRARLAMAPNGAFVIAWTDIDRQTPGAVPQGTMAQLFTALTRRLGPPFRVDSSLSLFPSLAMAANGRFIIAWGKGQAAALARTYDSNGTPLGPPFSMSALAGVGFFPRVGMDANGNISAIWGQLVNPGNSDQSEIYLRQYSPWISPTLQNGVAVTQLGGPVDSWRFYKIVVPAGKSSVEFSIFGGTGDADLYVRWGALPTLEAWDGAPFIQGNNETARMLNYPSGDWYIGVHGYEAYSGVSLRVSY